MHLQLAPGESPAPGTREACARLLADPGVAAVLVPLVPEGASRTARAARRYMAAWDARFVHDQTCFAPGARVATRDALPGWRAGDAAPFLWGALREGRRVVALRDGAVATPLARDLDAWVGWARGEGAAWGAAARAVPELARFSPARSRRGWWAHNVLQVARRVGEVAQARRAVDVEATWLHLARGAAWTRAFLES